ncbi:hypothetical protein ABZV65_30690 [Streptomyces bauhiniae]|uniref:hypothetical protein n=1 Tax=Streptomyces bauhiniae TaxID=2340725 RepID=UPI0033AD4EF2
MTDPTTHTFTGAREALLEWLKQHSSYRIADLTFPDGSVLLYLDAQPFAIQGWYSVAVGQTLDLATFPAFDLAVDGAAQGLARLLDRANMLDATLQDAESAKERRDPKTRARLLKAAVAVSAERRAASRMFEAHVAYDIREGVVVTLPAEEVLLQRLADGTEELPPPVREAIVAAAAQAMTGEEVAGLLVEAARTTLPSAGGFGDPVWRDRSALGNKLRRDVLPRIVRRVLADAPHAAVNEALRSVANSRRLE